MAIFTPYLLYGGISLVLAFLLFNTIRSALVLRGFGGPLVARLSRLWSSFISVNGKTPIHHMKLNETYGRTAVLEPNMLLTIDADFVLHMNSTKASYQRGPAYESFSFHPTEDSVISLRDEQVHGAVRARLTPGYSGKENLCLEADIDSYILKLMYLVRTKYLSTAEVYRPFDLSRAMSFFTLDVISAVAFGKVFGFLDADEDIFGYQDQLRQTLRLMMATSAYPGVVWYIRTAVRLARRHAPRQFNASALGKLMGFADAAVAERFGDKPVVRRDMLGSFLAHGFSQVELEAESLMNISAGSDTTASALRATLYFLAASPHAYVALVRELRDAVHAGRLTRPVLRDTEARELPYLQACIREGLRLRPPISGNLSKVVPPGGDTLDGQHVPAGVQVLFNVYGGMRQRDVFGDDALLFRPERWLPSGGRSEAQRAHMRAVQGLVFGAGRFGCLGKTVARMELNKLIAELLLRFELQIADPTAAVSEFWAGFMIQDNMIMRVEERGMTSAEARLVWDADSERSTQGSVQG